MLRKLGTVRRRVEQLATQVRAEGCGDNHQRVSIVNVVGDESTPPWPEADAEERCACGTALEFVLIVNTLDRV